MKGTAVGRDLIDVRFFTNGWRIGVGPFFIGWNHQDAYTEFRIGRILASDFRQAGGMSWKEWRQAKKDSEAARQAAKAAALTRGAEQP